MSDLRAHLTDLAQRLEPMCRHISVRDDEHGPLIFAIAQDDAHSLELRQKNGKYILELWMGKSAEAECLVETPRFADSASVLERARAWLKSGAV